MSPSAPKGRLPGGPIAPGEDRPPLKSVTFKADPACLEALGRLQVALAPGVRSRRSVAIRQAIHDAAQRLSAKH